MGGEGGMNHFKHEQAKTGEQNVSLEAEVMTHRMSELGFFTN